MPASRRRGRRRVWGARRDLYPVDGHHRPHAVQSGDRRNREGPPCPRDRRARRPDGAGDRRHRHPVQAAQSQPRAGGLVAARPGRQARLRRVGSRRALEREPNIYVDRRPGRPDSCRRTGGSAVSRSRTATPIGCDALVVTTGTFLNGLVHVGPISGPRDAPDEPPSRDLAESLKSFGFRWGRLKTGTPPRLHRRSIDFSRFAEERGDDPPVPFSFATRRSDRPQICLLSGSHDRARPRSSSESTSASRRSTTARSPASVRAIARRSKTR